MNPSTLLETLRTSQLVTPEQLEDIAQHVKAVEPFEVLHDLIEEGIISQFQAHKIWFGKAHELVLGQYHILDPIGTGSTGQVFKARHSLMKREVAVKLIAPHLWEDERIRWMFRREVLACTELQHPNIVMAFDANEIDGVLFLVMEYVKGPNLFQIVSQHGPLPITLAVAMMRQAALALQYADNKGMVHRDIKPGNLLIPQVTTELLDSQVNPDSKADAIGTVPPLIKVTDFGLAQLQQTAPVGTLVQANGKGFLGTPDYVSPEQANNAHQVDIRSDLYSLGCTFYYALTGKLPFAGKTNVEIILKQIQETPPPVDEHRPDIPDWLTAVISRLLEKEPRDRYQSPAELIGELDKHHQGQSSESHAEILTTMPKRDVSSFWETEPSSKSFALSSKDADRDSPLASQEIKTVAIPCIMSAPSAEEPEEDSQSRTELIPFYGDADSQSRTESIPFYGDADTEILDRQLVAYWQEWHRFVNVIVHPKHAAKIDGRRYRTLYRELLQLCRTDREKYSESKKHLLRQLDDLIAPWVAPQTLAKADEATQQHLLQRCQYIDVQLDVAATSMHLWMWGAILLLAGFVSWLAWYVLQST